MLRVDVGKSIKSKPSLDSPEYLFAYTGMGQRRSQTSLSVVCVILNKRIFPTGTLDVSTWIVFTFCVHIGIINQTSLAYVALLFIYTVVFFVLYCVLCYCIIAHFGRSGRIGRTACDLNGTWNNSVLQNEKRTPLRWDRVVQHQITINNSLKRQTTKTIPPANNTIQ